LGTWLNVTVAVVEDGEVVLVMIGIARGVIVTGSEEEEVELFPFLATTVMV
jgi:hypothetical protein